MFAAKIKVHILSRSDKKIQQLVEQIYVSIITDYNYIGHKNVINKTWIYQSIYYLYNKVVIHTYCYTGYVIIHIQDQ